MVNVPDEFINNQPATIGEEPDPPNWGWANGGNAPTDADECPECGDLVKHFHQGAGREEDGQRWHRSCWWVAKGYEKLSRDEAPDCGNCGLQSKMDVELRRENPLPDSNGDVSIYRCVVFGNYSVEFHNVDRDEPTDRDVEWMKGIVGTNHWFADVAAVMLDKDDLREAKNRGASDDGS